MKKIWKKIIIVACINVMMLVSITVGAEENYVFDNAGLMDEFDIEYIQNQIAELREKTDWDIFAVTIADAEGKTTKEYADDFYDARTEESASGFLVMVDMDNREIYFSGAGEAQRYYTDARIQEILDDGFAYLGDDEYGDCLSVMINSAEFYYEIGIEEDQYNYDVETGEISEYRVLTMTEVISSLLLSAGVGWLIYVMIGRGYKLKATTAYEYPYMKYGKLDVTANNDSFIRQYVTHQRIERNSSTGNRHTSGGSGARSSVHRSSSGRSHVGGGRKF